MTLRGCRALIHAGNLKSLSELGLNPTASHRLPQLDRARTVSALLVCVAHTVTVLVTPVVGVNPVVQSIGALARFSVLTFFVISGYAIAASIAANIARNDRFDALEFMARRVARIYPPLLFALLLTGLLYGGIAVMDLHGHAGWRLPQDLYIVREHTPWSWSEILAVLTNAQAINSSIAMLLNAPLWSLGYEVILYWTACLSAMLLSKDSRPRGGNSLALALLVLPPLIAGNRLFLFMAVVWAAGFAAFHLKALVSEPISLILGDRLGNKTLAALSVLLLGIHVGGLGLAPGLLLTDLIFVGTQLTYVLLLSLKISTLEPGVSKEGQRDSSYTLYVIHFPLLMGILSLTHPSLHQWQLYQVLLLAAAAVAAIFAFADWVARYVEDVPRFYPGTYRALKRCLSDTRRASNCVDGTSTERP